MGCDQLRFLVFGFGALATVALADAAEQPRACQTEGSLAAGEKGVVHHAGSFPVHRGEDRPYETFSLSDKNPEWEAQDPPYSHCFRYEYENTGSSVIEDFEWRDIEVWRVDLYPGERQSKIRKKPSKRDTVQVSASEVIAFENSKDTTQAHFIQEHAEEGTSKSSKASSDFTLFRYAVQMPDAIPVIETAKLRNVALSAYLTPTSATEFMPLYTSFSANDMRLIVESRGKFVDGRFVTETIISLKGVEAIFVPGLFAIQEAYEEPLDISDLKNVAEELLTKKGMVTPLKEFHTEMSFLPPEMKELPGLFVIDHPVTILTPSRAFCVGVSTYSPVPISVGGEYCNDEVFQ